MYCYSFIGLLFSVGVPGAALHTPSVTPAIPLGREDNRDTFLGGCILPATTQEQNGPFTASNVDPTGAIALDDAELSHNENGQYTQFTDASFVSAPDVPITATQVDALEATADIVSFLKRPALIYNAAVPIGDFAPLVSFTGSNLAQPQEFLTSFSIPRDIINAGRKIDKLQNFAWLKADFVFRIMVTVNPFIQGRLFLCFAPYDANKTIQHRIIWKSRAAITSYPGVEIDLQNASAAELRVPWSGLGDAFGLTNGDTPLGELVLFTLSSPAGIGAVNIPIQIYGWMENISLNAPTTLPVALQGVKEARGPITEISSKIGRAAHILKDIPIVDTVAPTVEWVANIASGVASIFGWSRPVTGQPAMPVANIPGRNYSHVKAEDQSVILGLSNENAIVEDEPNFLSASDEMSVSHVCARPGVIGVHRWNAADGINTIIGSYVVGPHLDSNRLLNFDSGGRRYIAYDAVLAEIVTNKLGAWRADWCFKFTLVKTPFHVGRFEVFYVPNTDSVTNGVDSTNLYRHIVDLTDTNEITFKIPYMHSATMHRSGATNVEVPYGVVVIRSLTPLSIPATVSPFVEMISWKWCENVAVAGAFSRPIRALLQGVVGPDAPAAETIVFGTENKQSDLITACKTVCGEMVTSLRALTRAHRVNAAPSSLMGGRFFHTLPRSEWGGYIGMCSDIYAFYRGGFSFKFVTKPGFRLYSTLAALTDISYQWDEYGASHFTDTTLNPVHEVQVPFYSPTRRSLTNWQMPDSDKPQHNPPIFFNQSTEDIVEAVMIGGKDDLTFGYLIGPPYYGLDLGPIPPTQPLEGDEDMEE